MRRELAVSLTQRQKGGGQVVNAIIISLIGRPKSERQYAIANQITYNKNLTNDVNNLYDFI